MSIRFGRSLRRFAVAASCLTVVLTAYAVSPLVTLWSVASALQRDDVPTLRSSLDWQTVRNGLKSDLGVGAPVKLASVRQASASQNDLPDFGSSFATTIVSHVVDDVMTPEHLTEMLSQTASSHRDGSGLSLLGRVQRIGFVAPAEFEAAIRLSSDVDAPPVVVTMHVEKWHWKVTRIHVPEQLLDTGNSNNRT